MLQVPGWKLRLRGEVLRREALPALAPAWDDLCARPIEDNVYYLPRYACALIDNIEHDPSLRFAAVWQGPKLIALLPFTRSKIALPFFGTAARAWQTDYLRLHAVVGPGVFGRGRSGTHRSSEHDQ